MVALDPRPIGIMVHGGTGRMGKEVAALASVSDGIVVRGFLDVRRRAHMTLDHWRVFDHISGVDGGVDVVVDFSHPAGMGPLVTALGGTGIRLVSGTTGLRPEDRALLKAYCENAAVLYDENMSYGVSVVKKLLAAAAPLWRDAADIEIVETHRRGKQDYPSGTAYALASVIDPGARLVSGRGATRVGAERVIYSHSLRLGGTVGDHEVHFATDDEVMSITHRALSRRVFARGALRAVRFVADKGPGMYSMTDLIEA